MFMIWLMEELSLIYVHEFSYTMVDKQLFNTEPYKCSKWEQTCWVEIVHKSWR